MFFSFKKRKLDPMFVKKFYYYSPEKLKLIPIKNFVPKLIVFLLGFIFLFSTLTLVISNLFFEETTVLILSNQNEILNNGYQKELTDLEDKYVLLSKKFKKLQNTTNNVRLAANLEPLNLDINNFGIGGSNFNLPLNYLPSENKEKLGKIYQIVSNIETNINIETSNYEEINVKLIENKDLFDHLPAITPVKSSYGDRYGMRFHPILKRKRMHHGLDFLANTGEEIFAPGDGTITYIGRRGGYGKVIRINHGFGYETIYAHLSKYKVKKGQKVKRGDIIALSGNSGSLSTGPHLHYEVRHNGNTLNPRNFIFDELKMFDNSSRKYLANK